MDNIIIFLILISWIVLIVFVYRILNKGHPVDKVFFIVVIIFSLLVMFGKRYIHDEKVTALNRELPSCKLIEENVYDGIFYGYVNKVNCNGVTKNIAVSDYQKVMAILKDK